MVLDKIMNYYGMFGKETKTMGIAYVPKDMPPDLVPFVGRVDNWQPLVMDLRRGGYVDYPANDEAWKLCSTKLKNILENSKGEIDTIQWLPVIVRSKDGEERDYFIMHIYEAHDVLDKKRTMYGAYDSVIAPVISTKLAAGHHIFTFKESTGVRYFISDRVRRNVLAGKCTGVTFEKTAAVD